MKGRAEATSKMMSIDKISLVYIGSIVPDRPTLTGVAFSRAGNMAQVNLLCALADAGLKPSLVLSQRPLEAFPRGRVLFVCKKRDVIGSDLAVELVPFVNAPILRPLSVGLYVIMSTIRWAWSTRGSLNRIVLIFNLTEPQGLFALLVARVIKASALAWINDINIPGETVPKNWMRVLDYWLQRKLLPKFDGLIVVNETVIRDFAPGQRYICIDGGVNPERLSTEAIDKISSHDQPFFIIVVAGSLDEQNGINEILNAIALLREPTYRLRIAGSGPLKSRVEEAASSDPRIEYCGYLSFDQVQHLYSSASVLVNMRLTKRIKTPYFFPSKLLEYMASGIPVISTGNERIEKVYKDLVFLLKDETAMGLADMIRFVAKLDPEERKLKGIEAREYIRNHGTWDKRANKIIEFIQSITQKNSASL